MMMHHHLGSFLYAAIVTTATAQTVFAHDCHSTLVPDIGSHEISLVAPSANVIATDGPSFTRQSGSQASTSTCDSPNDTARIDTLSEVSSATQAVVSNPSSNGPAISSGAANSMAVCRLAAPQHNCNSTVDGPNTKTNHVETHVPKPAHKLTRYDSAAFAGAGALIGAALLF
ncbi:hypothetical protein PgNI_05280 [Pyricularia grisea]|uniref:GPI anchored protein n=1 Tax=Pyricularia grisea TaxID=148305 RepID=A0A6P8B7X1_PYRGI|nr:hypothetical protein PgNI_05280 [Pyricularia grisea]TLD11426.1 hypothetical protein PgNI_05280 [Pyricularia grisea]